MVAVFMVQCPDPDQWTARDLFLKTATQVFNKETRRGGTITAKTCSNSTISSTLKNTVDEVYDARLHLGQKPFHLVWRRLVATFIEYLLDEDAVFCTAPEHEAYKGQLAVTRRLDWLKDRITTPPPSRFGNRPFQRSQR